MVRVSVCAHHQHLVGRLKNSTKAKIVKPATHIHCDGVRKAKGHDDTFMGNR